LSRVRDVKERSLVTTNVWMNRAVLGVSGLAATLSEFAITRLGRGGAIASATTCNAVFVRDAVLLASGATRELKRGPAGLLVLETAVAAIASALSIRLLFNDRALAVARGDGSSTPEVVRRVAITTLFAIHTGRYSIYLRPGHGLRATDEGDAPLT
jgi:hypothetical protein